MKIQNAENSLQLLNSSNFRNKSFATSTEPGQPTWPTSLASLCDADHSTLHSHCGTLTNAGISLIFLTEKCFVSDCFKLYHPSSD